MVKFILCLALLLLVQASRSELIITPPLTATSGQSLASLQQALSSLIINTTEIITDLPTGCQLQVFFEGIGCPASIDLSLANCNKSSADAFPDNIQAITNVTVFDMTAARIDVATVCSLQNLTLTVSNDTSSFTSALISPFGAGSVVIAFAPIVSSFSNAQTVVAGENPVIVTINGTNIESTGPWIVELALEPLHAQSNCSVAPTVTAVTVPASDALIVQFQIDSSNDACKIMLASVSRATVPASLQVTDSWFSSWIKGAPTVTPHSTTIPIQRESSVTLTIEGANLPLNETETPLSILLEVSGNCSGTTSCIISSFGSSSIVCVADLSSVTGDGDCPISATVNRLGIAGSSANTGYLVLPTSLSPNNSAPSAPAEADSTVPTPLTPGAIAGIIIAVIVALAVVYSIVTIILCHKPRNPPPVAAQANQPVANVPNTALAPVDAPVAVVATPATVAPPKNADDRPLGSSNNKLRQSKKKRDRTGSEIARQIEEDEAAAIALSLALAAEDGVEMPPIEPTRADTNLKESKRRNKFHESSELEHSLLEEPQLRESRKRSKEKEKDESEVSLRQSLRASQKETAATEEAPSLRKSKKQKLETRDGPVEQDQPLKRSQQSDIAIIEAGEDRPLKKSKRTPSEEEIPPVDGAADKPLRKSKKRVLNTDTPEPIEEKSLKKSKKAPLEQASIESVEEKPSNDSGKPLANSHRSVESTPSPDEPQPDLVSTAKETDASLKKSKQVTLEQRGPAAEPLEKASKEDNVDASSLHRGGSFVDENTPSPAEVATPKSGKQEPDDSSSTSSSND